MNSLKDVASVVGHYAVSVGAVAGAVVMGQPWTFGMGATAAGLLYLVTEKYVVGAIKKLQPHPERHPYSPRLGEVTRELGRAAGLSKDVVVTSFDLDPTRMDRGIIGEATLETFDGLSKKYGFSQFALSGESGISISDELLKILNPSEEKAILAQSVARIAADGEAISRPQIYLGKFALVSNYALLASELASVGVAKLAGLAVGSAVLRKIGINSTGEAQLFDVKKDSLHPSDRKRRDEVSSSTKTLFETSFIAAASYFNPAVASVWLATKAAQRISVLAERSLARSQEYQADRNAVDNLGVNPLAMMSALRKVEGLSRLQLTGAFRDMAEPVSGLRKIWADLNNIMPTVDRRLERLAKLANRDGYDDAQIIEAMKPIQDVSYLNTNPDRFVFEAIVK